MKKSILILLTFVPLIVGYVINITLTIPGIGMIIYYVVPLGVSGFWFYLRSLYSKTTWKAIPSVLIGSATGILSLILYLWQFLGLNSETRNMTLAVISQTYSAATPLYLFGRLAILFESQPNYVGQTTMVAMQVIAVIFMIVIFTAGYFWGRKHWRKSEDCNMRNDEHL